MDAKPQRALRPQSGQGQPHNENTAPASYNINQQRGKPASSALMPKDPNDGLQYQTGKRAAFGDVSNVLRAIPGGAVYTSKANVGKAATAAAVHAASVLPPVGGKENKSQTAGFLAPAQRAKIAAAAAAATTTAAESKEPRVKTFLGATRKSTVLNEKENVRVSAGSRVEPAAVNRIKQSPRHHKSQPCLKNATQAGPQQHKKTLRRTLSRLPVERSQLKENASSETSTASATTLDFASEYEYHDASDVPFDMVEDVHSRADLASLDKHAENIEIRKTRGSSQIRIVEEEEEEERHLAFLPEPTSAEPEEVWDDDADFYDEQGYTTAHSFRSMGDNTTSGITAILGPEMTSKIQDELDVARTIVESSLTPEDIDDEVWDISMVAEYGDDINEYMKELEAKMLPNPHYMDMQTELQWSMRGVLMDWLIQVHSRFNLLPETLFLTVNYVDRFLSSKIVSVNKLQLVGATAIFIAAKYEEIVCPSIQEIVYMVDGGYTAEEILKAERFMLGMLGFELGWPGPMSFLRRISKADDYDLETRMLAKYFLEVTVVNERFVACPPSFLAAGAHCLARLMLRKGDWSMAHTHYSGYTWSQVRPLTLAILYCCREPSVYHKAVYDKYADQKFRKASLFVEEELGFGFMIPPLNQPWYQSSRPKSLTESLEESVAPLQPNHVNVSVEA